MTSRIKHPDTMTKREILEALSGLFLAMFVSMTSGTIVSNALPTIVGSLNGTQTQYTWIVTATLLTSTVATPIWGKLADLLHKKLLLQIALAIFTMASIGAGFAQTVAWLIALRALQGIGLGGVQALAQTVMAAMIPPRERGKYNGYMGGIMAVATIGGPLIGGAIVDSPLGWRWVFFVGAPFAVAAMVLLQKTLHLALQPRRVKVDYLGATLLSAGVSILLIWVTFAGQSFAWASGQSALMVGAAVVLLIATVMVERRVAEPIIPLDIVVQRTPALAIIGSLAVGIGMFGGSVFLGQYFQIARGYSPTAAGLLMGPMMIGLIVTSTVAGRLISGHGHFKKYLVSGSVLLALGFALLATMDHRSSLVFIGGALFIAGAGLGMTMQNLVLAVQNTVAIRDIGASTSTVTFFRSLGGTVGVGVLGAMVANQLTAHIAAGLAHLGITLPAGGGSSSTLDLNAMPTPVAQVVRTAYGDVTGHVFLVASVLSVVGLIAVLLIKEVPLRETLAQPRSDEETIDTGILVEV